MTTLPQTAPIRLPRAGGPSSQLALPATAGPLATNPAQSFQMSGGDVWRVIRSNIWLIIIMLLISCGAGIGTFQRRADRADRGGGGAGAGCGEA